MSGVSRDLVTVHDDQAWTNSLIVADQFSRQHKNVLQVMADSESSDAFNRLNFKPVDYISG